MALGLAAFALVTLGNAERNAGLGVGRAAVLTVPVTLAGIVTVGGGNVLFAVAAVAGRYRRLACSLNFFFASIFATRPNARGSPSTFPGWRRNWESL